MVVADSTSGTAANGGRDSEDKAGSGGSCGGGGAMPDSATCGGECGSGGDGGGDVGNGTWVWHTASAHTYVVYAPVGPLLCVGFFLLARALVATAGQPATCRVQSKEKPFRVHVPDEKTNSEHLKHHHQVGNQAVGQKGCQKGGHI